MMKILIVAMLLIGLGAGVSADGVPTNNSDLLKIAIDNNDAQIGIVAWQDTETGQWSVLLFDGTSESFYLGNETGYVMIT